MKGERINFTVNTSFYKRSDWVDHIYEGLKAQTYKYSEWVVTDDFSPDKNAEERLKEIAKNDHRVVYYTQSRKKELFYNPNYGASGNVIFQMDSDDTMYPTILEVYAKQFIEDPLLIGICCGALKNINNTELFEWTAPNLEIQSNFVMTYGRAWRNVIPHFDYNGKLDYFQNDLNIWRQIEARGKVMFLPRELYKYNYDSQGSFSHRQFEGYNNESERLIEEERCRIEQRFSTSTDLSQDGIWNNVDECTFDLKYLPINKLTWAFYAADFHKTSHNSRINFIKSDIKPYEKQLLNELYYDNTIIYNGDVKGDYDEVIVYVSNQETLDIMYNFHSLYSQLKPDVKIRFHINKQVFNCGIGNAPHSAFGFGHIWSGCYE